MNNFYRILFIIIVLVTGWAPAQAVITVNPTGVNVRQTGSTTVFLNFRGIRDGTVVFEAFWCGAIQGNQECVPGTIFGRLPGRSNISNLSEAVNTPLNFRTFTDIMTIPPSVARRALQDAQTGADSRFFYVRRFDVPDVGDIFVAVTCRMAGGGARVPLSLTNVVIQFEPDHEVLAVARNQIPPKYKADIQYNGTGRLKGRWEVVTPGEPMPSFRDLLTEASLPIEERLLQKRYTEIGRFDIFLPPTGRVILPGADPKHLPRGADGLHLILLRIEATDERDSRSSTLTQTVIAGGVAGFPMPVLRYYVGKTSAVMRGASKEVAPGGVELLLPKPDSKYGLADLVRFHWKETKNTLVYKVEVANAEGLILTAAVGSGDTSYAAPSWLNMNEGAVRWRVLAYGGKGAPIAQSVWQEFQIVVKK